MTTSHETSTDSPRTVHGRGAESRTQTETETERNPKNARDHGTSAGADKATGNLREVTPLDALAAAVCLIRPDWRHDVVRATLARTNGSWREIATRALRVALDDDSRTPYAIENGDMRRYGSSEAMRHPSAVSFADRQRELQALDGDGAA